MGGRRIEFMLYTETSFPDLSFLTIKSYLTEHTGERITDIHSTGFILPTMAV